MLALAANLSGGASGDTLAAAAGSIDPDAYFQELATSMFAWSPPGAGIDAHRTWEALLVRTIPIVLRTALAPLYADHSLPVVVVDDYDAVTPADLFAATAHIAAQAEKHLPGPSAFAFYWLHRFEEAAASHPSAKVGVQ